MQVRFKRIDHINIVVRDLPAATRFFTTFGFIVTAEAPLSGEWVSTVVGLQNISARYVKLQLPGSDLKLELLTYYTPPSGKNPRLGKANEIGIRHIAFEVDDIDCVVSKMKALGVEFFSDVQTYCQTGKRLAYFYGPEGIVLEVADYGSAVQQRT